MADREVQEAWRLYLLNWAPLLLMALLFVVGLALTDFSFKTESLVLRALGMAWLFAAAGHAFWRRGYPRLAFALISIAQLELCYLLATPLAYLAAAANFPLQDATFAHFDAWLGLDWKGYYDYVIARPALIPYVYLAYAMIGVPTFGVPAVLGLSGNYLRLQQFTLACTLTAAVTVLVGFRVAAGDRHLSGIRYFGRHFDFQGERLPGPG